MASEWVVKMGIIEETRIINVLMALYTDLVLWARQWKNISLQIVDIEKENLQKTLDEALPEGADWLFFPCEISLFSADRSPTSPLISHPAQSTSTYILSGTPTKKTVQSLNFLKMAPAFVYCLLTSLVIVSATMSLIKISLRRGVSTLKDFGNQFLDNLWRTSLLFFYEPFIRTSRILGWRIVVSVWLIAISFIYIEMCSHLNSKFTETEITYVNSLANLPRDRYQDVIVIKDFVEEAFVNKMAEIDDNYRELKKRMQRLDETEFFVENPYAKFISNFVIVSEIVGKIGLKEMSTVMSELPIRGEIAFSEPLYNSHIALPIARNASRRSVDAVSYICLLEMETKILAKYFNEMNFLFFGMKWIKSEETFQDMTFGDIKSVLDLFGIGCLLAGFIFIVEFAAELVRGTSDFLSTRSRH